MAFLLQAFSTEELSSAKEQLEISCHLQQNLERMWKGARWVMDLITFARDKSPRPPVSASTLLLPPECHMSKVMSSPLLAHSREHIRGIRDNNNSQSAPAACNSNEFSVGKDHRKIAKFFDPNDEPKDSCTSCGGDVTGSSGDGGSRELSTFLANGTDKPEERTPPSPPLTSGILRVYAAYDTGLSKGVSVKLHITAQTTSRDVINLVVQHLNKAVVNKGREGPIYPDDELDSFCLVAVVGTRERILDDEYPPLRLHNPWLKGRLYVRRVNSLFSVIQQGQATAV